MSDKVGATVPLTQDRDALGVGHWPLLRVAERRHYFGHKRVFLFIGGAVLVLEQRPAEALCHLAVNLRNVSMFGFHSFRVTISARNYFAFAVDACEIISHDGRTMKTKLLEVKTRAEAVKLAPWAAKLVKVSGGYMAFESVADYNTWRTQK